MEVLIGIAIGVLLSVVPSYLHYKTKHPYDPDFNKFKDTISPHSKLESNITKYCLNEIDNYHLSANRTINIESVTVGAREWVVEYQVESAEHARQTQKENEDVE